MFYILIYKKCIYFIYFYFLGALGIQLSARIVDTPCNEMHTDGFIDEAKAVGLALGIKPLVIQGKYKLVKIGINLSKFV